MEKIKLIAVAAITVVIVIAMIFLNGRPLPIIGILVVLAGSFLIGKIGASRSQRHHKDEEDETP